MKKNNISKTIRLLLICLIVFPAISYSQLKYEAQLQYGTSNFIEIDKEAGIELGNKYTRAPSYSIGAHLLYPIKNTDFILESGLNYSSFSAKNSVIIPAILYVSDIPTSHSWTDQIISLGVPLGVRYKFEKWLHINMGLSYTFFMYEPKKIMSKKFNPYTINFFGEIDILVKQKFIVGVNYYKNLTPIMVELFDNKPINIKYYVKQISIKVGYIIN